MVHQDNPCVWIKGWHSESLHLESVANGRVEADSLQESPLTSGTPDLDAAIWSSPDLGLSPDLSRLPQETQHSIWYGGNHSDARFLDGSRISVCLAMLQAGYRTDEIWVVLTDPTNGISKEFFGESGIQAENALDQIINDACEEIAI